ncbi:MAG: methyl-accepting chemotaxis protein [Moraxellaceae bacterium]|nr:methyl-accepting chemotaxis protein [Moraxellaceae bacterium]
MRSRSTVSFKAMMMVLAGIGVATVAIISVLAVFNIERLVSVDHQVLEAQGRVRVQADIDMMHDGIRGDVLASMMAMSNANTEQAEAAAKQFSEHAERMRSQTAANRSGIPESARAAAAAAEKLTERYIASAQAIIGREPGDILARKASFDADFDTLEEELEKLTDALQDDARQLSETATANARRSLQITLLTGVAGAVLLLVATVIVMRQTVPPLHALAREAGEIARSGDLTRIVPSTGSREVADVADAFRHLLETQRAIVAQAHEAAASVQRDVGALHALSQSVSAEAVRQDQLAEEAREGFAGVSTQVEVVAGNAERAVTAAREAGTRSTSSAESVRQAVGELNGLNESVHELAQVISSLAEEANRISSVVVAIKEIADQTNLLALNAAIEAARAGEQGRGFAVVADEVRKLAERTTRSTDEVFTVIESIRRQSTSAVATMERNVARVEENVRAAGASADAVAAIPAAAAEVVAGMQEIRDALAMQRDSARAIGGVIERMSEASHSNADAARQVGTLVDRASVAADSLAKSVGRFRI